MFLQWLVMPTGVDIKCLQIVAVNQPFADMKAVAMALSFDTVHGWYGENVNVHDNNLCIGGKLLISFFGLKTGKKHLSKCREYSFDRVDLNFLFKKKTSSQVLHSSLGRKSLII